MKVFLTGGPDFIGQPLTHALMARGWNVVALVRKPDSPQACTLTKIGAQCVAGDVTDRESMRAGMQGADIVVQNAGWYEFGVPGSSRKLMHATNVVGTDNVLSLALELGISRSVYVSSTIYWGETDSEVCNDIYGQEDYNQFYTRDCPRPLKMTNGQRPVKQPLMQTFTMLATALDPVGDGGGVMTKDAACG